MQTFLKMQYFETENDFFSQNHVILKNKICKMIMLRMVDFLKIFMINFFGGYGGKRQNPAAINTFICLLPK